MDYVGPETRTVLITSTIIDLDNVKEENQHIKYVIFITWCCADNIKQQVGHIDTMARKYLGVLSV